jgi:hypothetical protein
MANAPVLIPTASPTKAPVESPMSMYAREYVEGYKYAANKHSSFNSSDLSAITTHTKAGVVVPRIPMVTTLPGIKHGILWDLVKAHLTSFEASQSECIEERNGTR